MRSALTILFTFFCFSVMWAKDIGFSFEYPDSLKKNADVVYLFHHTVYTRTSNANLKEHIHFALTILSDRGDENADFVLSYDQFSTIGNIECIIYNEAGEKVRKIKNSEIMDYAAFDGYSLFNDNRIKHFSALNPTYPYTIELEYEINYNGFIAISSWYPVEGYRISVKEADVTLKYPPDLPLNYKEKNIGSIHRTTFNEDKFNCFSWKTEGIVALEYEQFSPAFNDHVASVSFSPTEFSFDKTDGEINDWKSLGTWNYGLLDTNYVLTEKTKQQLMEIKSQYSDKKELVKQVYKFMQSRTRYVSIQLGIGGFKPFSPQIVDEVGYGDCKALSYYAKSLLNAVGISSYYTIIGVNGTKIEFNDFPSFNQMNHAILCVPIENDTIWLECTSQTAPFNHLFNGSTGRKALLVNADGGKIVRTPLPFDNSQLNKAVIELNSHGEIVCNIETTNSGTFFDESFYMLQLSDKELREELLKMSPVSDIILQIAKVTLHEEFSNIIVNKTFTTHNFVTKAGNRMFIELSQFLNLTRLVAQKSVRKNPVFFENNSVWDDEITLQLPAGYTLEYCPEGKNITSDFGFYQSKIESNKNQIIFKRTMKLNKATFPKDKYLDFIQFYNSAADADKCKVILKM
jgi:hypothetical protein